MKSGSVVGKPQSRELPAMMRIKEVAIADTAVPFRGCKRRAAQHQLINHELAVIFPERALDRPVAGIGGVGAAGPLPDDPERVVEMAGSSCDLPFHFGRQMLAAPAREGVRLIIADVADGGGGIDRLQPTERHHLPFSIDLPPV